MSDSEAPPPPPYDSVVIEKTEQADSGAGAAESTGDNGELGVKVYDPVKQGEGMSAYVSYRVETKTNLPQYQQQENEVIRRFRDFAWLKSKLAEKNPGIIIPPVPEKDVVQKYSMAADFISRRCHALNVFVNRLCKHPVLKFSSELQFFLEAQESAWQAEVQNSNAEKSVAKKGFLGAKKFFKGVASTTSSLITGKNADENEDAEYLKVKSYSKSLETHMIELYAHAEKLTSRQRKLNNAMKVFGEGISKLGEKEGETSPVVEEFSKVADKLCSDDTVEEKLVEFDLEFVEPMKEYSRYVTSLRNVMVERSAAMQRLQDKKQSVETKKNALAKLRATPGAKEEKLSDAEQRLNESSRKLEEATDRYDLIVERMKTEMSAYHSNRKGDMLVTLSGFADKQAILAEEQAQKWKELVASLTAAA
jgi:sorting nexin-1/2